MKGSEMKIYRIFSVLILILFISTQAFAAGTMIEATPRQFNEYESSSNIWMYKLTCTADGAGNFSLQWTSNRLNGYVLGASTDPGVPIPANGYDIIIRDWVGYDLFGGTLLNRSSTESEYAQPRTFNDGTDRVYGPIQSIGRVSISVSNIVNANATFILTIYVDRGP